jgi:site-specific DNA recombinase
MQWIFSAYLAGKGLYAIAEALTQDGISSPSAYDPARNRHRTGVARAKSVVRAILLNPRYAGHQVWNRQRKDEVLLDVDDVTTGTPRSDRSTCLRGSRRRRETPSPRDGPPVPTPSGR